MTQGSPQHAPQNAHPVVGVGALLFRPDGRLLIGRRIKSGEPARWCLPGGHVEAGETFEEAAVREIAEESGIEGVADARVFTVVLRTEAAGPHVTAGVVATSTTPDAEATTPEPKVFDRWLWVRPDDLPTPLFPATAALLAAWHGADPAPGWTAYPSDRATAPR